MGPESSPDGTVQSLRLEVVSGEGAARSTVLSGLSVIGRDESCAFVIAAPAVSREHAVIRPEKGFGFVIEDLDSRSGTFVNGNRTRKRTVQDGDLIRIGPVEMRVRTMLDVLDGEVPLEQVEVVKSRHQPTTRLTLDAVRFQNRARDLSDAGQPADPVPDTTRIAEIVDGDAPPGTVAARLEQLCEISISMASIHQPERLMRETAMRVFSMYPQARRVGFFELEEDAQAGDAVLRPRYVMDRDRQDHPGRRVQISETVLQAAVDDRQAVLSENVDVDPRFKLSKSLSSAGIVSIVCVPLCLGERLLGALYVDATDPARPFDEGALRLITGVGAILAAAFENARLFARVQAETVRRASLERYFSPALVERVLRGEVPLARQGRMTSGTILFVDIRGFTRLTDTTEPTRLVAMLNAYFAAMQRIIFGSGGTVERFGGDSILAYWGVVERDPRAAARGAGAALRMLAEVFRLNPELEATGSPPLRVAVGVNTGNVVVGDVGSPERYEFTILGTAINLARRMETLAGAWEVIAGADTLRELGRAALYVPLPPTTVKGRDRAVALSALYGLRVDDGREPVARYVLAIEATLDLAGQVEITLVTGVEVASGRARLEVLTAIQPGPGARAKVVFRLPRTDGALTVLGRARVESSAEETLMIDPDQIPARVPPPAAESAPARGLQRLQLDVDDAEALLRYLAVR